MLTLLWFFYIYLTLKFTDFFLLVGTCAHPFNGHITSVINRILLISEVETTVSII